MSIPLCNPVQLPLNYDQVNDLISVIIAILLSIAEILKINIKIITLMLFYYQLFKASK